MAAIDLGSAAVDGATNYYTQGTTTIMVDNPANDTGRISSVEIWSYTNLTSVKVGTFTGSGTDYIIHGYASLGTITSGSKQTVTGLSIPVTSGDFLGIYSGVGQIEASSGGSGLYYVAGDKFSSGTTTYTFLSGRLMSLYAIGATAGGVPIFIHHLKMMRG
jgi:hypothetical protein